MIKQDHSQYNVDVLIVGAGPTGLTLASELQRFGVDCKVIDKALGISTKTKALGVMARTLEHFQRMGLAKEFVRRGHPTNMFNVHSGAATLARLDFKNVLKSPYPMVLMIPQNVTEDILYSHFLKLGGGVEWGTSLSSFNQGLTGVEAIIITSNGEEKVIKAKYLIGCDGAHSNVRRGLNMEFEGIKIDQTFGLADLYVNWDLPHDESFAFIKNGRLAAFFPMKNGQHRILFTTDPHPEKNTDITLGEIQQVIDEVGPRGTSVHSPTWQSRFHVNQRKVKKGSSDRIFLAGDAAHIHSPIGAQGMNTGLQDAFNLAWKLAFVLNYQSPPSLLETYTAERDLVWSSLLRGTERATKMVLNKNLLVQMVRNTIAPKITARNRVKEQLVNMLSQLAIHYRYSPIVEEKIKNHSRFNKSILPGDRAPDGYVNHGNSLFKLMTGKEFSILLFTDHNTFYSDLNNCLKTQPIPFKLYQLSSKRTNEMKVHTHKEQYGFKEEGIVVIRPDGYVGFICDHISIDLTLEHIRNYSR